MGYQFGCQAVLKGCYFFGEPVFITGEISDVIGLGLGVGLEVGDVFQVALQCLLECLLP